jgi:hypothetical protein
LAFQARRTLANFQNVFVIKRKNMRDDLERIEELYRQTLSIPKKERAAFLAEACVGVEALESER